MVCISSSEAWKKEEEAISERNVRLILEAAKASLRSLRHTPPLSHSLSLSPSVSPFSLALSLYPTVPVYFCTDLMCEEGRNLDRLSANGKHSRNQNADTEHHTRRPLSFLLPERNSLIGFAKIHRMWGQTADQREGAGEKNSVRGRDGVRERKIDREGNRWAHLLMKESEGAMGRHSGSHIHCVLQLSLSLGLSLCRPMNNAKVRLCQWNLHSRSDLVCSSDQGPFQQSY